MYDSNPQGFPASSRGDLNILAACPSCRTSYHPLQTRIVAERDDAHLLFLECRQCGSAVVALVTTGGNGIHSFGTLTDLTSNEVAGLAQQQSVSADDVVELYEFLNEQSSVVSILRREKDPQ